MLALAVCSKKQLYITYMFSLYVNGPTAHMWRRSEDNLRKSVLSLRQVGPRVQTKIVRLGSRGFHLIHLPGPHSFLKSGDICNNIYITS